MTDVSKLPPPEEGASEGYYPDPLGGTYQRWWDGEKWTYQVGPEQTTPEPENGDDLSDVLPRRPRRAGEVVSAAFRLYGRYPLLFLILAAGVIVPYDLIALAAIGTDPTIQAQVLYGVLGYILISPLISALHVHAVAEVREGRDPHLGPVARRGIVVLPVVAAATIMSGLGILLGLVALIVPGVILYFRWFVVAQVAAIDHEGWLPALRGSHELTHRNYGHIFVFLLLVVLVLFVPNTVMGIAFGSDVTSVGSVAVGLVVHLFTASFTALATAVLYYDLVSRRHHSGAPVG
jgi:uncharacterized protein DUF2510